MKVLEIKINKKTAQVKSEKYEVILELETLFKYNVSVGKELSLDEFVNICNESDERQSYRIAFEALKKRLTIKELKDILIKNSINQGLINKIISDLINRKYLNDLEYALEFLDERKSSKGINQILESLSNKGISGSILEIVKSNYRGYIEVNNFIEKYLNKKISKPKVVISQSLKKYLYDLGFDEELIQSRVDDRMRSFYVDEKDAIKKDYIKLAKKYSNLDSEEMILVIKKQLINKGYQKTTVMEVISEFNNQ